MSKSAAKAVIDNINFASKIILPAAFLAATIFGQAAAVPDVRPLTLGKPIEREMKGGEAHSYNIALAANQYANFVVEQSGIDVEVTLFDTNGKKLAYVDSCTGDFGSEPLYLITEAAGNYRIDVVPLTRTAAPGYYEVKIEEQRATIEKDKLRIAAEKIVAEADLLQCEGKTVTRQAAIKRFDEAVPLFYQAGARIREAETLVMSGSVLFRLGENRNAIDKFSVALQIAKTIGDKGVECQVLYSLGEAYHISGSGAKAVELYTEALPLSRAVGNLNIETTILYNRGNIYTISGEHQKAIDDYNLALKLFRDTGSKGGYARTLNSLGFAHLFLGENRKALAYLTEALPLIKIVGDREFIAAILNNTATAFDNLGESQKAFEFYTEALSRFRANQDKNNEAKVLASIGRYRGRMGEHRKALDYYKQALSITKDGRVKSQTLINAGWSHASLGENQAAVDYFTQGLSLSRAILYRRGEASALDGLQSVWSSQKDMLRAIFFGKQSVNKYQELRAFVQGLEKETQNTYLKTFENAYRRLADLLISEGRFAEARQVLAMLKDEEYFDYLRRDANQIKNLKNRVSLTLAEQKLIERYDLLGDNVTAIGAKYEILAKKRNQLPQGQSLPAEEQKQFDELSVKLEAANAAFKLFLDTELVAELGKAIKADINSDRSLLAKLGPRGAGEVALFTVAGEDRYRVFLTTSTVQVDGKTEIKSADLNKKIFAFREALQNPAIDPRPLGKELYDILIKPVETHLTGANAKTLVWSLDGTLRYIPLAALSPDGKSYLIEKYQSVIVTSATRQDLIADNEKDWRTLGLGVSTEQTVSDPGMPNEKVNFKALPGVKAELTRIVRDELVAADTGLLAGRRLIDDDFSVKNFGDLLTKETPAGKRKFTTVHIASHFRLGDNSANSFLLLGGGSTLTLQQINDLPQMKFGGVELVTLSACDTAFGSGNSNGKEVDSLAAFIETRGAKAVLATLWPVVDESTQMLMSEFYRRHKQNPNISKAEAMQQAQKAMIQGKLKSTGQSTGCRSDIVNLDDSKTTPFKCDTKAPYSHPNFWSPFVLIGNWR